MVFKCTVTFSKFIENGKNKRGTQKFLQIKDGKFIFLLINLKGQLIHLIKVWLNLF